MASKHHICAAPTHPWAPPPWGSAPQAHLRALLLGACKRAPNNAEAFTHFGLFHLRNGDGEDALRAFQRGRQILDARVRLLGEEARAIPASVTRAVARLRALTAQAAHVAASSKLSREERAPLLDRLQADFVASTAEDVTQPDVWNALALLHLGEGGFAGARDILRSICAAFPDYLDALNNLGLAELALGNEREAIACFQKVVRADVRHVEALSNYGTILLKHGVYEAAARTFRAAVEDAEAYGFGMAFAWGGLAIAEAANGHFVVAENAAISAKASADSTSSSRFNALLGCVRARRAASSLRRHDVASDRQLDDTSGAGTEATPGSQVGPGSVNVNLSRHIDGSPILENEDAHGDETVSEPRVAVESAVALLRGVSREAPSALTTTALGAVLRLKHECSWEETGNRNNGAESAERLVEAIEADKSDSTAWVQLALLQLGAGDYESARDFGLQAVVHSSDSLTAWNTLGVSYHLNNELPEAIKAYEKVIAGAVSNESKSLSLNELNGNGADSGHDFAVAGLPSGSVCSDGPEEKRSRPTSHFLAAVYNNLGNAKRQGKLYDEALSAYEKSLEVGGESPAVYNNIALLYVVMDRHDDAEKMLRRALTLAPFFDASRSNLLRLQNLKVSDPNPRVDLKMDGADATESSEKVLSGA